MEVTFAKEYSAILKELLHYLGLTTYVKKDTTKLNNLVEWRKTDYLSYCYKMTLKIMYKIKKSKQIIKKRFLW